MSSSIVETTLGDVTKLVIDYRGKTPLKLGGAWSSSGYRAVSAKNIESGRLKNLESIRFVDEVLYKKWMKDEVERGDILITSEAPFGEAILWDSEEKIVLSQRVFGLRLDTNKADPEYVYFYMKTPSYKAELEARATGSTVRGLRQPELLKTRIFLPEISTQQKIAKILGDLDRKIELNRRMNETLEQIGQALFRRYFIDNPEREGWGQTTLGAMVTVRRGSSLLRKDMNEGNVPVVSGGLEPSGYHDKSNTVSPVITVSGSGANAGFLRLWNENVWSADSSFIDKTITEYVYFFYIFLKSQQDKIYSMQTGAAQPHIYPSHLERLEIVNVPQVEIASFEKLVTPLFKQIGTNEKETVLLVKVRDLLLPKLMSGQIAA